jgi:transcriptional regulator with XRE-family HTH domain
MGLTNAVAEGIGPTLAEIRTAADLKQAAVADALTVKTTRISRIETGDLSPDADEVRRYLRFVGTEAAKQFLSVLEMDWLHMPRPAHWHPQLQALKHAEHSLTRIDAFVEEPGVPRTLLKQAAMHRESLRRHAEYLSSLDHTVGYVGEVGAGKTTAICFQTGLLLPGIDKNGIRSVALDTGSGRVTICEVRIRSGSGCGVFVSPAADTEVYKLVGEFCEGVWAAAKPGATAHADEPKGLSVELDRAIRNMAGLGRTSRTEGGKRLPIDPAAELARECASIDEFRSAVAEKIKLPDRNKREAWYEGSVSDGGLEWLRKIFADINNGRDAAFGLPERIDIVVPFHIFSNTPYRVEIVDTRGIEQTVIRPDLRVLLDDPRTVVVLASRFNNAPDPSLQELLKHLVASRTERAIKKALLLVLARTEEVLATKDAATGQEVETEEEGYEIKGLQVDDSLRRVGLAEASSEFFNARTDQPSKITDAILNRITEMRAGYAKRIEEIAAAIEQMIANKETAAALEAQREVNKVLLTFAAQHRKLHASGGARVHELLIGAVRDAYARTVWATTRRGGTWGNLDVYHHLGEAAERIARRRSAKGFDALREHIGNKLGDPDFAPTHRFLKELLAGVEEWEDNFLTAARTIGTETFRPTLEDDSRFWDDCSSIYGQGRRFRNEVAENLSEWFNDHSELHDTLDRRIQTAWVKNVLTPLREVCEGSLETGEIDTQLGMSPS